MSKANRNADAEPEQPTKAAAAPAKGLGIAGGAKKPGAKKAAAPAAEASTEAAESSDTSRSDDRPPARTATLTESFPCWSCRRWSSRPRD